MSLGCDEWVINGEKRLCGNALNVDFIAALVRVDDPESSRPRAAGLTTLIIEKGRGKYPKGLTGTPIEKVIDGPDSNFGDPEGYRQEAGWTTTLDCGGNWAIHPSQTNIAYEVFSPTATSRAATARVFQVTLNRQTRIDTRTA